MKRRSDCPISFALDLLGDKWSLLVVRDLAFHGKKTFSELLESDESIATNILSERLGRLEDAGIVEKKRDPNDRRRFLYVLSPTGVDLIPVLVEIIVWSAEHDPRTAAPKSFIRRAKTDRKRLIKELRAQVEGAE